MGLRRMESAIEIPSGYSAGPPAFFCRRRSSHGHCGFRTVSPKHADPPFCLPIEKLVENGKCSHICAQRLSQISLNLRS